jgi:hypothetical protein
MHTHGLTRIKSRNDILPFMILPSSVLLGVHPWLRSFLVGRFRAALGLHPWLTILPFITVHNFCGPDESTCGGQVTAVHNQRRPVTPAESSRKKSTDLACHPASAAPSARGANARAGRVRIRSHFQVLAQHRRVGDAGADAIATHAVSRIIQAIDLLNISHRAWTCCRRASSFGR